MIKQLKVILEDLILFLIITATVSYIYSAVYPDSCNVPSFFNPLGISYGGGCTLAAVRAPPHLFFISVDLLIPLIVIYGIFFLSSALNKLKERIDFNISNKIIQILLVILLIIVILAYITPRNCNGYYCEPEENRLGGTSLKAVSVMSLFLSSIAYLIWYFAIKWINKRFSR